jgi:adenylate kinase
VESGFSYLSTGGLLRAALRDHTILGEKARPFLDQGEYVPDEIMVPMVMEWLEQKVGGVVLDGFPRTVAQAVVLDEAFEKAQSALPEAISLDVPFQELQRRVEDRLECEKCHWVTSVGNSESCSTCGGTMMPREDDDAKRFQSRFREFERLTSPVIAYYEEHRRLHRIKALASPDDVHTAIRSRLTI